MYSFGKHCGPNYWNNWMRKQQLFQGQFRPPFQEIQEHHVFHHIHETPLNKNNETHNYTPTTNYNSQISHNQNGPIIQHQTAPKETAPKCAQQDKDELKSIVEEIVTEEIKTYIKLAKLYELMPDGNKDAAKYYGLALTEIRKTRETYGNEFSEKEKAALMKYIRGVIRSKNDVQKTLSYVFFFFGSVSILRGD